MDPFDAGPLAYIHGMRMAADEAGREITRRAGRRAEAEAVYQGVRSRLLTEAGLPPGFRFESGLTLVGHATPVVREVERRGPPDRPLAEGRMERVPDHVRERYRKGAF